MYPDIIKDVTGPSPEYVEFMSKYRGEHALCPVCGSSGHSSTLVGYILYMDEKQDYKDLNTCVCTTCGDVHTAHDRKPKHETETI